MPVTGPRCEPWREPVPRLVAESLQVMDDLLATTHLWPRPGDTQGITAALARLLAPASGDPLRAVWPTPVQALSARRLLAALDRFGGAMLADPIGSGKTFVALAVANEEPYAGHTAALVPAPLREQWRQRALAVGVPLEILSHTEVSLGRLPSKGCRLVIVDESHHFRSPQTHRYDHLGRFLLGRRLLLVTATPAVNRLIDIAHQLRLGIRDDALAAEGTTSLLREMRRDRVPHALGRVVITSSLPEGVPARHERSVDLPPAPDTAAPSWLAALDELTLADRGEVATLIRGVLLGAAGSSPAALHSALTRYRDLLLHAREAATAGHTVDRRALRRFTAESPEQLLMWELLPVTLGADDLPHQDLEKIAPLLNTLRTESLDPKADRLQEILADGRSTIVFTTAVATVPYLRDRLSQFAPAWVTGNRAGWRHITMPRDQVFRWFGPTAPEVAPHILVASDVAAEGLDLQRAGRIIHYDLPWTAMRLAQREGRSRRLGARHAEVEVVTFTLPRWLEERTRLERTLRRKGTLPRQAGLAGEDSPWRWRQELGSAMGHVAPTTGVSVVTGPRLECLVGVSIVDRDEVEVASSVAVISEQGGVGRSPTEVTRAFEAARTEIPSSHQEGLGIEWKERVATFARAVLRSAREGRWSASPKSVPSRALMRRLQVMARAAARERAGDRVARLDDLIAFAARGHTAGEELRVSELLAVEDPTRSNGIGPVKTGADESDLQIRIVGVILFVP